MFKYTTALLAAAVTASALAAPPAHAVSDWELLGKRKVNFNRESDVIEVGRREGAFNALRIEVDHGPLEMYNIRVVFTNGQSYSPNTRIRFPEGSQTRVLDLPGDSRTIDRIVFRYKARNRLGATEVKVYGRTAGDSRPDRGNSTRPDDSWIHLGARDVDFQTDHDAIQVPGDRRFNRILIAVEGADVEIFNISVNFANGEHYDPEVRMRFEANTRSRFIDLPGTARDIKNVEFRYRTLRREDRKAVVHLYGKTR